MSTNTQNDVMRAEINLGYFKQGDDLSHHVQSTSSPSEALRSHAAQMKEVANHLEELAFELSECEPDGISLEGDTHFCGITGPSPFIEKLIEKKLVNCEEQIDQEE